MYVYYPRAFFCLDCSPSKTHCTSNVCTLLYVYNLHFNEKAGNYPFISISTVNLSYSSEIFFLFISASTLVNSEKYPPHPVINNFKHMTQIILSFPWTQSYIYTVWHRPEGLLLLALFSDLISWVISLIHEVPIIELFLILFYFWRFLKMPSWFLPHNFLLLWPETHSLWLSAHLALSHHLGLINLYLTSSKRPYLITLCKDILHLPLYISIFFVALSIM